MSLISTEASAITKSVLKKGYNGDCLNLNGRVTSTDEADKGFRASGVVKLPYYCVLASCPKKNISAGIVTAFSDYTKNIKDSGKYAREKIDKYINDMKSVAKECGAVNVSQGILFADSERVLCASSGNIRIFRYTGVIEELKKGPEEVFAYECVTDLADGDIFVMLGGECSSFADVKAIENIIKSNSEMKDILQKTFIQVATSLPDMDCSVVVVRIKADKKRENTPKNKNNEFDSIPLFTENNDSQNDDLSVLEKLVENKSSNQTKNSEDLFALFDSEFEKTNKNGDNSDEQIAKMGDILGIAPNKTSENAKAFDEIDFSGVVETEDADKEELFKNNDDLFGYDKFIGESIKHQKEKDIKQMINKMIIAVSVILAFTIALTFVLIKIKNDNNDEPINDFITLEGYSDDYTKKHKKNEKTTASTTAKIGETTVTTAKNTQNTTSLAVSVNNTTARANTGVNTTRANTPSVTKPTTVPTTQPTTQPTTEPTTQPTTAPTTQPAPETTTRRTDIDEGKY